MREFIFLWTWRNEEHIGIHDIAPEEAEFVVTHARPPYPEVADDAKFGVRGPTKDGRLLQVVYVVVSLEDVHPEEFQRLRLHERIALEAGELAVRIIHARDLTSLEKRRLRRRKRGQ